MSFSTFDLQQMLARLNQNKIRQSEEVSENLVITPADLREKKLHDRILAKCAELGWIALHGSMAHASHRTIGEPDFIIIADRGRTFLVECKRAKGGKVRPEQAALLAWAAKLGHRATVCRSFEEFLKFVEGV